jgi:hypothetical protein
VAVGAARSESLKSYSLLACLVIELTPPRCAAGEAGVRALGDLDLFGGEALADGHAGVAQAVDEHVAACFLPADDVAVAESVAVLTGAERDPGLRVEESGADP